MCIIKDIDTQGNSMRTNIVLDDQLMATALKVGGLVTKKATIEAALQLFVQLNQQSKIRHYRGKLQWQGNLEEMRAAQ